MNYLTTKGMPEDWFRRPKFAKDWGVWKATVIEIAAIEGEELPPPYVDLPDTAFIKMIKAARVVLEDENEESK